MTFDMPELTRKICANLGVPQARKTRLSSPSSGASRAAFDCGHGSTQLVRLRGHALLCLLLSGCNSATAVNRLWQAAQRLQFFGATNKSFVNVIKAWEIYNMHLFRNRISAVILVCVPISGCFGVTIPEMQAPLQSSEDQRDKENTLVNLIKCQLKQGVSAVLHEYSSEGPGKGYDASWINTWAAKVTFTLTAQETSKFSPNFSYTNHPQIFSLALGADAGADATRTETTALTWSVPEILSDAAAIPCKHFGPFKVTSDLQIAEWLLRKAFLARVPGNIDRQKLDTPFTVFNYEAIFVSTYSGGINPGWSFNRRTVNDNTTFFNLSRSRTDSVNITMGPASEDDFGGYKLARDAEDVRLATLIGQAVRGR